jgi:hypothetical protein
MKRNLGLVLGVLALIVAIGVGYAMYGAAQKRAQQRQVVQLVADSTEKLREALTAKADAALVAAIDANLKATKAPRDPQLADAAEQYITSAREIAKRRVEVERLTRQAAASRAALAGHMAHAASRRNDSWMRDALALKKRVENDHFELGITLKALYELLFALPDTERLLEPRIGTASLLEPAVTDSARRQAQADVKRAAEELDRARNTR